jgi:hypothetical protein
LRRRIHRGAGKRPLVGNRADVFEHWRPALNELVSIRQANALIDAKTMLHVAGDEAALRQLHRGTWFGGTIPYFLTREGGLVEREKVFVTSFPDCVADVRIKLIDIGRIPAIATDAPRNGFSFVIVPGMSDIHTIYSLTAGSIPGIREAPIIGWVAGVHLDDLGKATPKVFDGATGEASDKRIVVMHAALPGNKKAHVGMINLFRPGGEDRIVFQESSFSAGHCTINGRPEDFYDYAVRKQLDTTLPLVTERSGDLINVSFQAIDARSRTVKFYAPVMKECSYRQATPLPDYRQALVDATRSLDIDPIFACNCILNYVHGHLEGAQSIPLPGPATFGELAQVLMNQTLVYLTVTDK